MLDAIHFETLTRISEQIRNRELSSLAVTKAMLDRIERLDGTYRSYTTVLADRALAQAETADREIAKDIWRGPLHGVPIAVKDLCNTIYAPTGAGTTMLRNRTPDHNATVVDRLV